jgi:hypothetical protein
MHRTWFSLWTLLSLLVNLLAPAGVSAASFPKTESAVRNPSLPPRLVHAGLRARLRPGIGPSGLV